MKNEIDWTKPVETSDGQSVVASFVNMDGTRHAVIRSQAGYHYGWGVSNDQRGFRNVLETPAIDWTKPVEYLEQHEGWLPVIASYVGFNELRLCVVKYPTGEHMYRHNSRGEQFRNVQRKVKWQRWVNLYPNGISCAYESKEHADKYADEHRLECRLIEWESIDE